MTYESIKIIHAVGASVLFGGGLFLFAYCIYGFKQAEPLFLANTLNLSIKINLGVFSTCGFIQLITGFLLITMRTSPLTTAWLLETLTPIGIAALCWLISVNILGQCYQALIFDSSESITEKTNTKHKTLILYRSWLALGSVAITCCLISIYFMTTVKFL